MDTEKRERESPRRGKRDGERQSATNREDKFNEHNQESQKRMYILSVIKNMEKRQVSIEHRDRWEATYLEIYIDERNVHNSVRVQNVRCS